MATDRRLLELALKGLEAERDVIVAEIDELRARLGGRIAKARRGRAVKAIKEAVRPRKRRKLSASQRKAISERMKKTWAARRKKARK
jgi:hypothetical protein